MSPLLPRRAVSVSLSAALLGGALVGFSFADELRTDSASTAVAAAELERAPLPLGSDQRGLAGVERSALDLAAALDAVPVRADGDESTRYCNREDLRVRWTAPEDGEFQVGGHIDPVGPAPGQDTDEVNGLVVCDGASYAYMGFEARWDGAAWSLAAVPALSDEHDLESEEAHEEAHDEAHDEAHEEPAQAAPRPAAPRRPAPRQAAPRAAARGFAVPPVDGIDPYAAYDPQRICDPVAKPGTAALRDLLLRTYPGSRNLGVSRTCTARGTSEHKEGRAFDWGVNKGVPAERAAAEGAIAQLLATDGAGHRHALARRLGVMYLIWDRQIWSAYSASRGWRPYSGANAHTDHVHISLSWDGAMGRTSYWSGANATLLKADPELRLAPGSPPVGGGGAPKDDGAGAKAVRWTRDAGERDEGGRDEGGRDPVEQERWAQERREHLERRAQQRAERAERKAARREGAQDELGITALAVAVPAPTDVRTAEPRPEVEPVRVEAEKPARVKAPKPERTRTPKARKAEAPKVEKATTRKAKTVRTVKAPKVRTAKAVKAVKAPKVRVAGGGKGKKG